MLALYDSTGDQTLSYGTGSLVGQNIAPNPNYNPPTTGFTGDVQSGVLTAIRISPYSGAPYEVCETVPVLNSDGITFTYSRGKLLKSSTGSRISFPSGINYIRFVAPAEAFPLHVFGASVTGSLNGSNYDFTLPFTPALDANGNPSVQLVLAGAVISSPGDYLISGTAITMTWPPTSGPFLAYGIKE